MLNICTVCKAEFEDDESSELTDVDVCSKCFHDVYIEFFEGTDEPLIYDTEFYQKSVLHKNNLTGD